MAIMSFCDNYYIYMLIFYAVEKVKNCIVLKDDIFPRSFYWLASEKHN